MSKSAIHTRRDLARAAFGHVFGGDESATGISQALVTRRAPGSTPNPSASKMSYGDPTTPIDGWGRGRQGASTETSLPSDATDELDEPGSFLGRAMSEMLRTSGPDFVEESPADLSTQLPHTYDEHSTGVSSKPAGVGEVAEAVAAAVAAAMARPGPAPGPAPYIGALPERAPSTTTGVQTAPMVFNSGIPASRAKQKGRGAASTDKGASQRPRMSGAGMPAARLAADTRTPEPDLFDQPTIRLKVREGTTCRHADNLRLQVDGRMQLARAASEYMGSVYRVLSMPILATMAPSPLFADWLTYTIDDVFANALLGWDIMGAGVTGVVVGGCIRKHALGTRGPDGRTLPPPSLIPEMWEWPARGERQTMSCKGQQALCVAVNVQEAAREKGGGVFGLRFGAVGAVGAAGAAGGAGAGAAPQVPLLAVVKLMHISEETAAAYAQCAPTLDGRRLLTTAAAVAPAPPAGSSNEVGRAQDAFLAAHLMRGRATPFREVYAGYAVNALVANRVSPHFALLYHAMLVRAHAKQDPDLQTATQLLERSGGRAPPRPPSPPGSSAKAVSALTNNDGGLSVLVMGELCDMELTEFLTALFDAAMPAERQTAILRTVIIQCVQALAAMDAAFNMRHNDLHSNNVMVTLIDPDAVFTYTVHDPSGPSVVEVPTFGVCVKLIDFGRASSNIFGVGDTSRAYVNNPLLIKPFLENDRYKMIGNVIEERLHTMERFDIIRLTTMLLSIFQKHAVAVDVLQEVLSYIADGTRSTDQVLQNAALGAPKAPGARSSEPLYPYLGESTGSMNFLLATLAKHWGMLRRRDVADMTKFAHSPVFFDTSRAVGDWNMAAPYRSLHAALIDPSYHTTASFASMPFAASGNPYVSAASSISSAMFGPAQAHIPIPLAMPQWTRK